MALLAGFAPQEFLGVGGALCDPLRGGEHANRRDERLPGKIARRVFHHAKVRGMRGDVVLKFLQQKLVDDLRRVVRDAGVEVFVEGEEMAGGAGGSELHGSHEGAGVAAVGAGERDVFDRQEFLLVSIGDLRSDVLRVGVSPRGLDSGGAMAIGADELDDGAVGTTADGLHVEIVIEFDGARVGRFGANESDFGVAVLQGADVRGVGRGAAGSGAQVRVAFGASFIACGGDVDASAMLAMAGGAVGHGGGDLVRVVDGAVVAGFACAIHRFGGKLAGGLKVADFTLFFEDGVGGAHASTGEDARIGGETAPGDPGNGEKRRKNGQGELCALEARGALEIVQVDALRDGFCCASA